MALAKNLQMAGIANAVVTAETPERLARHCPAFFDKILIDAPCSGEGMFRRGPRMVKDWLEKGPEYYSKIQKEILEQAYQMLKSGGMLVYSTCTFSVQEDENVVQWLLTQHSDMEICPVERKAGFSEGRPDMVEGGLPELKHCVRIFPQRAKGEGHFAVLLRKRKAEQEINADTNKNLKTVREEKELLTKKQRNVNKAAKNRKKAGNRKEKDVSDEKGRLETEAFLKKIAIDRTRVSIQNNAATLLPADSSAFDGLRIIAQGLPICEWKHKLNYSHQLALTLTAKDFDCVLDLKSTDEGVIRYLKGETIFADEPYQGMVLVCVDGYGLGWAQGNMQGVLKNKYYAGWRYQ
jgi:hypothetical protein